MFRCHLSRCTGWFVISMDSVYEWAMGAWAAMFAVTGVGVVLANRPPRAKGGAHRAGKRR